MPRLKRRHLRKAVIGLLVLITLSWLSMGCYACALGELKTDEQHSADAAGPHKGCHEVATQQACPHCGDHAQPHSANMNCDQGECRLYQVSADDQWGWSLASVDQSPDFTPVVSLATAAVPEPSTSTPPRRALRQLGYLPPHPTTEFCSLLI